MNFSLHLVDSLALLSVLFSHLCKLCDHSVTRQLLLQPKFAPASHVPVDGESASHLFVLPLPGSKLKNECPKVTSEFGGEEDHTQ